METSSRVALGLGSANVRAVSYTGLAVMVVLLLGVGFGTYSRVGKVRGVGLTFHATWMAMAPDTGATPYWVWDYAWRFSATA